MKKRSIFAVSLTKGNFITQNVGSYFYDYTIGADICKDKRGHQSTMATAFACFSCSWSRCGGVASPLLYTYLIFHSMTKSNENVSNW